MRTRKPLLRRTLRHKSQRLKRETELQLRRLAAEVVHSRNRLECTCPGLTAERVVTALVRATVACRSTEAGARFVELIGIGHTVTGLEHGTTIPMHRRTTRVSPGEAVTDLTNNVFQPGSASCTPLSHPRPPDGFSIYCIILNTICIIRGTICD